jgi:hypothetical protein
MKPDSIFSEEVILTLVNALDPATRHKLVDEACRRLFNPVEPRSMPLRYSPVVDVVVQKECERLAGEFVRDVMLNPGTPEGQANRLRILESTRAAVAAGLDKLNLETRISTAIMQGIETVL